MKAMTWRLRRAAVRLHTERVELQHLLDAHGPGSRGVVMLLLAAPCLLPVPGMGMLLGWGLLALAWSMWHGHAEDRLPDRVARLTLPRPWARRVLALLARCHAGAARVARPRLPHFAAERLRPALALMVGWLAVLIILPIPFGNVLPAVALMLLGLGLVWLDGLLVAAAAVTGSLATLFPVLLGVAAFVWGPEALTGLLPGLLPG